MATIKTQAKKPAHPSFTIRSLSITTEDTKILDRIAQDASDYLGWTVAARRSSVRSYAKLVGKTVYG